MAGGGAECGLYYGAATEFGIPAVKDRVHIHYFQATVLHLPCCNHKRLTCRHHFNHYRFVNVFSNLARGNLA